MGFSLVHSLNFHKITIEVDARSAVRTHSSNKILADSSVFYGALISDGRSLLQHFEEVHLQYISTAEEISVLIFWRRKETSPFSTESIVMYSSPRVFVPTFG